MNKYLTNKKMIAAAVYLVLLIGVSLSWGYQHSRLKLAESNVNMLQKNIGVLGKARHSLALTMKNDADIETLIKHAALSHGVPLQGVTFHDDDMNVSLSETSFSRLIGWLAEIQRDFGIVVKKLQVKVTADGDNVKVDALCLETPVRGHDDVG
ncbi:General secretion pathway, M protein [Serratia ficaria]|uniref:type II secretion system protein M n=1 Tax=Serratia ficaria TaxID=61651 RepID=UPI002179B8CB|nr:type II secretion system protein M [Serratia ficaria]CAI2092010.1 General secretion pathway, M protein [Serratia ficaria]CAI2463628.1 General secretion pathway, M protein [Serratia ficaria]